MHAFVQEAAAYTSKLEVARRKLHDLELEHKKLLEEEKLRCDLDMTLDEDSSYALRIFPVKQRNSWSISNTTKMTKPRGMKLSSTHLTVL
jgi:hypothetical protein